ncbi:serine hydrolase [Mucilaginibacter polytrichastri]|uniref:Penicillin-binding protein 4 n=1 Tax=Mucilaginibacter polytrichastri TaxID=1302689 RepID=A0A1Q6A1F7_9SPHI|nr:serine hydrolase [Mucilaginibacter polytrichastri]OKS87828.1 Penicillin-binding protein 4* [Mucilaginibacter polytrichastri]SFT25930.1 CubicO group peptidase, beta-lactamase class C family [Mucilaginibacter polytrichastri]
MRKALILFCCLPFMGNAQSNNIKLIDLYLNGEYQQSFNGNVLIAQHGKTIYQKAFGYRNIDLKLPLNNSSVFELASVSKQFTALSILQLKEQGKLKLTDSLRAYFPQLPYHNITIQNLLTHTSGLPDYLNQMIKKWDHKQIAFNNDVIDFLAINKPKLLFTPGSQYEYSNTGYVILASIIEKLTGESYNNYLKQQIFKPLGMDSSRVYNTRRSKQDTIANYAYGYVYNAAYKKYVLPDSLKKFDFVYWLDGITGDGTVNSTTRDLLKWNNALLSNKLINALDQKDMLSPHVLTDTITNAHYGYGIDILKDELGNFTTHSGSWPGYTSVLTHYETGDYTVIVLSNNESNAVGISQALCHILNGRAVVQPYRHQETNVDPAILDKYVGTYMFTLKIELVKRDGKLYRHLPGRSINSDVELKPESPTKFFYSNRADIQIEFELDKQGNVAHSYLINYGLKIEARKSE